MAYHYPAVGPAHEKKALNDGLWACVIFILESATLQGGGSSQVVSVVGEKKKL